MPSVVRRGVLTALGLPVAAALACGGSPAPAPPNSPPPLAQCSTTAPTANQIDQALGQFDAACPSREALASGQGGAAPAAVCMSAATALEAGQCGLPHDGVRILRYYGAACASGSTDACNALTRLGVPPPPMSAQVTPVPVALAPSASNPPSPASVASAPAGVVPPSEPPECATARRPQAAGDAAAVVFKVICISRGGQL
jgi:hypothetical protein